MIGHTVAVPYSIRTSVYGESIWHIIEHAIQAVDPRAAVERHLEVRDDELLAAGRVYPLKRFKRVRLVGIGKAADPMVRAAASILGPYLTDGILVTKQGHWVNDHQLENVKRMEGGHPIPDHRSLSAARQIVNFLQGSREDDLILILISGGGSALLAYPAEAISIDEMEDLTRELLACGADIYQINTLRKHLDIVKGGGLARIASPATQIALILSDVIGDRLDVIASGPTVPDPTTYQQAQNVLHDLDIQDRIPASIKLHLERGALGLMTETPKPGDAVFSRVHSTIIGSNSLAVQAAQLKAQAEGFHTLILTTFLHGEAREAGRMLSAILMEEVNHGRPLPRPACLIAGGETTVTLNRTRMTGLGGRNQELALGAAIGLAGLNGAALISLATDGGDGMTDAAGAVANGDTFSRALKLDLNPVDFLDRNDSYHFFQLLDDLIYTGPTLTNVNDLVFLFSY